MSPSLSEIMRRKNFLSIVLLLAMSLQALSQELMVKNAQLEPLAGASLLNLEDATVLITDQAGVVRLNETESAVLLVSHIGYTSKVVVFEPGQSQLVILSPSTQKLDEVIVEGFVNKGQISRQAGGIALLEPGAFKRYNETSLVQAFNTIPGFRFEERASSSYRISIRGSSIRSPFGVRNVKVYWNDIPFTEPGGNTFINLLDLSNVAQAEVIKGPSTSVYGAGNGGVIKLKSTDLSTLSNASELAFSMGSFGLLKASGAHNFLQKNSSLSFKWSTQEADGYRDHNAMDRKTLEFDGLFFPDEKRTISASLLYSDLFYQIPGGLNPEQRAENPKQSRPRSIERNASVANELYLLKLGHEFAWSDQFQNKISLGLSQNQFENPFILDYKRDNQQAFSLRSEFLQQVPVSGKEIDLGYGVELQRSFFDGKNFGNINGIADTIRFADEIDIRQSDIFLTATYPVSDKTDFTVGLSRNDLTYDINRTIDRINNNPQSFLKEFDAQWSKRVAISHQLSSDLSIHLSAMDGFSAPTTTEVRTNEGSINQALQAEKGINYELNFRGNLWRQKLSFDLALFHYRINDAITTFTNMDGVVLFRNAGETRQNGLELATQVNWLLNTEGPVNVLSSRIAYTYHDFSFENYVTGGDDFSGNPLPGTAPHVLNLTTDLVLKSGLQLNLTYHYSDPIPLNDENTFFSEAYQLVNLKAAWDTKISKNVNLNVFVGVDNLLDVSYSLGNDLNAFGRRYFQPAPGINYYAGIKLKFNH